MESFPAFLSVKACKRCSTYTHTCTYPNNVVICTYITVWKKQSQELPNTMAYLICICLYVLRKVFCFVDPATELTLPIFSFIEFLGEFLRIEQPE